MKNLRFMIPILVIAMLLTGCSLSKPDSVVKKFNDAMKVYDIETMKECVISGGEDIDEVKDVLSGEESSDSSEAETFSVFADFLREQGKKMKYSVTDTNVEGDTGYVTVKYNYVDASPVVTSFIGEYFTQAFALAFSGASDDAMNDLAESIFNEKKDSVACKDAELELTYVCSKKDGEWKIDTIPEEAINVMVCNMNTAFDGFKNEDGSTSDADQPDQGMSPDVPEEEEFVWSDVKAGNTVELATIKITVNGAEEATKLEDDFSSTDAQAGTKFVLVSVTIENITKEGFTFSSGDVPLYDNQERQYTVMSDAFWYVSDALTYEDLSPNIPVTGYFVYNVPTDSEDYYLSISKAGTNEAYRLYTK